MAAYVRNRSGYISAVNEADLATHLQQPGMAQATLEDWLAQEGLEPQKVSPGKLEAEPVSAPAAKPGARKQKKGE